MKKIKKLVNLMKDEIESAECYSEKALEYKMDGNSEMSQKFAKMASDELEHGSILHDILQKEIDKASQYISVPADMREKWELSHAEYIERVAKIKSYISMA